MTAKGILNSKKAFRTAPKKPRGKGKPFEIGNKYAFKLGVSGNPGGRPAIISGAYKLWLSQIDDETGLTHAQLVAQSQGQRAIIAHDTTAAKELRQATEGDTLKLATWQNEIVDALKSGTLTAEDVIKELGIDDARSILVAAGTAIPQSAPTESPSEAGAV